MKLIMAVATDWRYRAWTRLSILFPNQGWIFGRVLKSISARNRAEIRWRER